MLALRHTAVAHQSYYYHPYTEAGVEAYRAKAADEAYQNGLSLGCAIDQTPSLSNEGQVCY